MAFIHVHMMQVDTKVLVFASMVDHHNKKGSSLANSRVTDKPGSKHPLEDLRMDRIWYIQVIWLDQ